MSVQSVISLPPPPQVVPPRTYQSDPFEHANSPDDEGEVGRDAERIVEGDLGKVSGESLEVDALRSAAGERHVEHIRQRWNDRRHVYL